MARRSSTTAASDRTVLWLCRRQPSPRVGRAGAEAGREFSLHRIRACHVPPQPDGRRRAAGDSRHPDRTPRHDGLALGAATVHGGDRERRRRHGDVMVVAQAVASGQHTDVPKPAVRRPLLLPRLDDRRGGLASRDVEVELKDGTTTVLRGTVCNSRVSFDMVHALNAWLDEEGDAESSPLRRHRRTRSAKNDEHRRSPA